MQDAAKRFSRPKTPRIAGTRPCGALFVEKLPIGRPRTGSATPRRAAQPARRIPQGHRAPVLPARQARQVEARLRPRPRQPHRRAAQAPEHCPADEIAEQLTAKENIPVSSSTVGRVLRGAGLPKLWRRTADQQPTARVRCRPPSPTGRRSISGRGASEPLRRACSCSPRSRAGSTSTAFSPGPACPAAG